MVCGMRVHINLHHLKAGRSDIFSVTKSGKVQFYTDSVVLANPKQVIAEGKYQDCLTKNKRHVCAWIDGEVATDFLNTGKKASVSFSYNPFKSRDFYYMDSQSPVDFGQHDYAVFQVIDGKPHCTLI